MPCQVSRSHCLKSTEKQNNKLEKYLSQTTKYIVYRSAYRKYNNIKLQLFYFGC